MDNVYGTLTIQTLVSYRWEGINRNKWMTLEIFHGLTRQQAKGITADFKGENSADGMGETQGILRCTWKAIETL